METAMRQLAKAFYFAFVFVLCPATVLPVSAAGPVAANRPNIIFLLSDDVGIGDIGCYGADRFRGKTPNIDRLAATGIRFDRCYSTPLCGPSRCQITTGRYPFRTGALSNGSAHLPSPSNEFSIAKLLKQAGYATGQGGKWQQLGATPADWGYDEYLTDPNATGYYWETSYVKNGRNVELGKKVYMPDVVQEFAVDFIRRHRDQPFFFYYATHLVHDPMLPTPDSSPKTKDKRLLFEDNIVYMDKHLGQLVEELERLKIRDRTVVLFAGDNGTAHGPRTLNGRELSGEKVNGGVLYKGTLSEGGSRVPLVVNWPGTAPADAVYPDLVDFSDFFATFAELAGAKPPSGVTLDSHSFAQRLLGRPGQPREWIFVQLAGHWYVRNNAWKLTDDGRLLDVIDAPFAEKVIAVDTQDPQALAARRRLQAVLGQLNPAGGKTEPPPRKAGKSPASKENAPPQAAVAGSRAEVTAETFVKIYDQSVGEKEPWFMNDHCFVRGPDGTWHMFGIAERYPVRQHNQKLAHATAARLTQSPWDKKPFALIADPSAGEQHLWAPHVILHDGTYYMFYSAGNLTDNSKYRIHLATSKDLVAWTRHPANPMVVDGYGARDPFILEMPGEWVMYYEATSEPAGGSFIVACRKSKDLIHWGERTVVFTAPAKGKFGGPTESPTVIRRGEYYYLFVGPHWGGGGYVGTAVFRSKSPYKWQMQDKVGNISSHAAEVVRDVDGQWYISHCGWNQGGLYLAKLHWNDGLDEVDTSMPVPSK